MGFRRQWTAALVLALVVISTSTAFAQELKVYQVDGFFERDIWGSLILEPGQTVQLRADHVDPWFRRNHTPQEEFTWVLRSYDSGTMEVFEPFWRGQTEHFRMRFNEIEFTAPANVKSEQFTLEIRDRSIGNLLLWLR